MGVAVGREKTRKDDVTLSYLLKQIENGTFRTDHPLQRYSDQWSKQYKDSYIATLIKKEDIDSIKVCEQIRKLDAREIVEVWLIDGIQRLTVAQDFQLGGFKLGKNIEFPIMEYLIPKKDENGNFVYDDNGVRQYEVEKFDLRGKGYKDLPDILQETFDNYMFSVVKQLECTDEEVGYHIRRYNHQKSMNQSQAAITYLDCVANRVKKLSNHRFFTDCVNISTTERINGGKERIVIEALMLAFFPSKWNKLRPMGEFLNKNSEEWCYDKMERMLDVLESQLEDRHAALFTGKNSYLFIALFNSMTNMFNKKEMVECGAMYNKFLTAFVSGLNEKRVDGNTFSELDSQKSSKDKGIVTQKLNLLESLLRFYFKDEIEKEINTEREKVDERMKAEMSNKMESESETKLDSDAESHNENETENTENNKHEESDGNKSEDEAETSDTLEFIRECIADKEITDDDLSLYKDMLDDLTLEVNNYTKLLDKENEKSLLAIVAFSMKEDINLDNWLPDFFGRNTYYLRNQKENYERMKNDLLKFEKKNVA